jgi:hypothetical protein
MVAPKLSTNQEIIHFIVAFIGNTKTIKLVPLLFVELFFVSFETCDFRKFSVVPADLSIPRLEA